MVEPKSWGSGLGIQGLQHSKPLIAQISPINQVKSEESVVSADPGPTAGFQRRQGILGERHAHGFKSALEGVKHQPQNFQRHYTQKRFVAGITQNDRSMAVPFR